MRHLFSEPSLTLTYAYGGASYQSGDGVEEAGAKALRGFHD